MPSQSYYLVTELGFIVIVFRRWYQLGLKQATTTATSSKVKDSSGKKTLAATGFTTFVVVIVVDRYDNLRQ